MCIRPSTPINGASVRRRVRVLLVGTGRMGAIRAKILYANPKFDFLGVCDINLSAAKKLADVYSVRHWLSALPHAFGLESNESASASA